MQMPTDEDTVLNIGSSFSICPALVSLYFPTVFSDACVLISISRTYPIFQRHLACASCKLCEFFQLHFSVLYFSTCGGVVFLYCISQLYFSTVFLNLQRRILSWISGLLFHLSLVSVLAATISPSSQLSRVPEEETIQGGDNTGRRQHPGQNVLYWTVF